MLAPEREASEHHADERPVSRADRSARSHPGVPAAGRAAAAARADAAQHFRAALSRHDRRRLARRPPADRHDPARRRACRRRRQAAAVQDRLRRPHHPARRERRRPLSASSSPASRASASSRNCRSRPTTGNAASLTRRSPTISSRARARRRSTATAVLKALARLHEGQQSAGRLGGHRPGAERGAGQRAVDDVALWRRRKSRRCWRRPT